MRVESPLVQQSLVDTLKSIEKKDVTTQQSGDGEFSEDIQSFIPSPFGSSGTYSLSSLRAAVDYNAKFLTVAENNQAAVNHTATIPQSILARFKS
jgi:hypothetical protein